VKDTLYHERWASQCSSISQRPLLLSRFPMFLGQLAISQELILFSEVCPLSGRYRDIIILGTSYAYGFCFLCTLALPVNCEQYHLKV
jgi:hypothetical protein